MNGAVLETSDGTLGGGAVLGTVDSNFGDGGVLGAIVGRYVARIFYRVMMA